jgi:pyruvate/2-oxoglutarate dehydrogenase complex dihydrolipoamide acyltransferase (E2) component
MSEVKVPDIGGYSNVPVIEVLVQPGDTVAGDQGRVTGETVQATRVVPSTVEGKVRPG